MDEALGFLQLCADRRYHRPTMTAFEHATGLRSDQYWVEARAGGAPSWPEASRTARIAYRAGARHMGWAAHGDVCLGFEGEPNDELRRRLAGAVRARVRDFPAASHYMLFGEGGDVAVHRAEA